MIFFNCDKPANFKSLRRSHCPFKSCQNSRLVRYSIQISLLNYSHTSVAVAFPQVTKECIFQQIPLDHIRYVYKDRESPILAMEGTSGEENKDDVSQEVGIEPGFRLRLTHSPVKKRS